MEKRVYGAIGLCVLIFIAWQKLYIEPRFGATNAVSTSPHSETITTKLPMMGSAIDQAKTGGTSLAGTQPAETTLTHGDNVYTFSSQGGSLVRVNSNVWNWVANYPQFNISVATDQVREDFGLALWKKEQTGEHSLTFSSEGQLAQVSKVFSVGEKPGFEFALDLKAKAQNLKYIYINMYRKADESIKLENERSDLLLGSSKGLETTHVKDLKELKESIDPLDWMGIASRYFISALTKQGDFPAYSQMGPEAGIDGHSLIKYSWVIPFDPQKNQYRFQYYFGPKHIETLKMVHPRLALAVDFGWFTIFAYPLLSTLRWLYNFLHNYGLAIILLTMLVKLLTFPLTYKSVVSMKRMQVLQPQINALKEKYKDDKQQFNQEMMRVMKEKGYNPMSGCLPILIQMPIYVALYNVLNNSIELYGQPFFGWIHDLSAKDPFFVTPILLGIFLYIQQKLTPNTSTDPAQQKMLQFMPLMFTGMMLWLPSGLTLYMLVNSVLSVLQQFFLNKKIQVAVS